MARQERPTTAKIAQIGIVRFGAWVALAWERLWPLLVPLVLVATVFVSLSWLGIWDRLAVWAHFSVLAIFAVALLAALLPLRRYIFPSREEISRRIEVESNLEDRPIAAQSDEIELGEGDAFSKALWQEHQLRMRQRLADLTGGTPRASGDRFDPYGLRLMLPILAFVALMVSSGGNGGSLSDAFRPGGDPAKLLTRLDVWVNPPGYTSKPPVYLSVDSDHQVGQTVMLPQFSQLVGRFVGKGEISLRFDDGTKEIEIAPDSALDGAGTKGAERNYNFELDRSGIISVYSRRTKIAQWSLETVIDTAPQISFDEAPGSSLAGSLQLNYSLKDDYGVASAVGLVKPLGEKSQNGGEKKLFNLELSARFIPPANARALVPPLEIKLSLPRRRAKTGSAKINRDVSKHPLAGSLVELTLMAEDDAGQQGFSEARELLLPGRVFSNPIAKALVEQRRILALDANQQEFVAVMLDAVATAPEKYIDNFASFLAIKAAYRRLVDARNDDQLREVMELLWDVALGIEFGKMSDAERRLREAQERLSEALQNGADDKEIDKLMTELRQAMNELMQALAEQARQNPQANNPMQQNDDTNTLSQRDMDRMMDRIEDLAKSGSKDAARELLAEMQRMMDNLRAGLHQQQRQAEGNQLNESLNKLSELMQRQQDLMDETFRMQQQNPQNRQNPQGDLNRNQQQQGQNQPQQNQNGEQQDQNQNGQMTPQEFADALEQLRQQQEALQEQLDSLSQQLGELGLQPGEFDEAGEQMGEAGEQLGQGKAGSATGNQAQALDALRRGAQSMMRQMAGDRQQGGQQQSRGSSGSTGSSMRDPLGRNRQNQGRGFGNDTEVPGEIDAQRAREILEAIRKRLSQPQQRIIEKDYLERLLKSR